MALLQMPAPGQSKARHLTERSSRWRGREPALVPCMARCARSRCDESPMAGSPRMRIKGLMKYEPSGCNGAATVIRPSSSYESSSETGTDLTFECPWEAIIERPSMAGWQPLGGATGRARSEGRQRRSSLTPFLPFGPAQPQWRLPSPTGHSAMQIAAWTPVNKWVRFE